MGPSSFNRARGEIMIVLSLLLVWIVVAIMWSQGRRTSEALRVEVERLTDEVDELRNQLKSQGAQVRQALEQQ
jgi:hypothetical protein